MKKFINNLSINLGIFFIILLIISMFVDFFNLNFFSKVTIFFITINLVIYVFYFFTKDIKKQQ